MVALATEALQDQPSFRFWDTTYSLTDPTLVGRRPGDGLILMASEDEWTDWIIAFGRLHGWLMMFARDGARNVPVKGDWGFPDGVAVRGPRLEFIEAKSETGLRKHASPTRSRPEQHRWLARLGVAAEANPHVGCRLWAPQHAWEVMEVLA